MSISTDPQRPRRWFRAALWNLAVVLAVGLVAIVFWRLPAQNEDEEAFDSVEARSMMLMPPMTPGRLRVDTSGFGSILAVVQGWKPEDSLQEISRHWKGVEDRILQEMDNYRDTHAPSGTELIPFLGSKAEVLMAAGRAVEAYDALREARAIVDASPPDVQAEYLGSLMYFQGVAALRRGEDENCIMCRGESSCIVPIQSAAVHQVPTGSRLAIAHFTEYLQVHPEDLEVRWLLNLAHMTLGEHPHGVDPRYLISLDKFTNSELDIGRFRDIGHLVGINRFGQAGGALLEDFDNDGLLDFFVTSFDPTEGPALYHNTGKGAFADVTEAAGIQDQLGGLVCLQTDYNNDGLMDIYIPRGAWLRVGVRPTLLRNDGDMRFTDVTAEAGLLDPVNSNAAQWIDYDNDGWLDLFVGCENQPNRLYRNRGDGTFEEMGIESGVAIAPHIFTKGCTWFDYDNDDRPDLFVNYLDGAGQLYHNDGDGDFTNVTDAMGLNGPMHGFSCWAWDYDNDGWLDLFATCYHRNMGDVVKGMIGQPHACHTNRLYRNVEGKCFEDVTQEAGLDVVLGAMGSNYADFDNDGFLDMYLGTGEPNLGGLMPNRMFKNVDGRRFVEITGTAGVGHLQKGHGIACGDWDRDGNVDLFAQMGGAVNGDKYHDILFQNPGHPHAWLTVKLIGKTTNRAALGARIKVVAAGEKPLTVHRHISPGSSFGSNPLEQTIGLGAAERIATLEIHWPTSGETQVFHDVSVNQSIEITEHAKNFKVLDQKHIPLPE